MKKHFIFTIDDNIRFLQELTEHNSASLFSHPYTNMLKELHEVYGIKVQLNLFYQNSSFTLSQMTDKYQEEWAKNSNWLKLSFHSRLENVSPYQNSDYEEVYEDCQQVHKEIFRFAGKNSLAKTTTIHYCQTTEEGVRSLKNCGVKGLLGLYGTLENPRISYTSSLSDALLLQNGKIVESNGIAFSGIDIVLNCFTTPQNLAQLQCLQARESIKVMIHEQYFYKDYKAYQPDFKNKLEAVFLFLRNNGFESCFFEDIIALEIGSR